jgi:hypothetical protein
MHGEYWDCKAHYIYCIDNDSLNPDYHLAAHFAFVERLRTTNTYFILTFLLAQHSFWW